MSNLLSSMPKWVQTVLFRGVGATPFTRRKFSRAFINGFSKAAPGRPRPHSMAAAYPTWRGLTDRRFSGLHLPSDPGYNAALPAVEDVSALFKRTADVRATDTSLLFPFFAQWFTDSFLRTKWKPEAEQDFAHNESNHEIDLCQIYGMGEVQTTQLRDVGNGGRLKSQPLNGEEFPVYLFEERDGALVVKKEFDKLYTEANFNRVFNGEQRPWTDDQKRTAFAVGLEHGNATLGNSLMNTLFLREHNRLAGLLKAAYPDWDDERLFQTARNINIVKLLKIVILDYIVHISPHDDIPLEVEPGWAEKQKWYRTNWITVEFALLYRWHDLIPDTVTFGGDTVSAAQGLLRANTALKNSGLDTVIKDASSQKAGRIGLGNTPDFLHDVKKLSLTMARTCGLKSYNDYRRHFGLEPMGSFEELTQNKDQAQALRDLYGHIDNLEWFVGIFAEHYDKNFLMGWLLTVMVANDAFTQALTNPLLAKAVFNEETFSAVGMDEIAGCNGIADIVLANTGLSNKTDVGFKIR